MACFKYILVLFVLLVCILFSCKPKKIATVKPEEKTAFYTIKLIRDTIRKITHFEVKDLMISNTKLNHKEEGNVHGPDFLKFEIIDKKDRTTSVITAHPLYKRVDLYSESGEIESKLISLQQGEVTFRVPYFEAYKKIVISETINGINSKPTTLKNEK